MLSILVFLFSTQLAKAQDSFDPSRCDQIGSEMYFLGDSGSGCCPGYTMRYQDGVKSCYRAGVSPNNATAKSTSGSSNTAVLDELARQCTDATDSAKKDCVFDSNPAVKNVLAMASGLKQQMNTQAAGSQAYLCSQMGSLAQAIDGAVAAYSGFCSAGYAKCSDSCDSAVKEAQNMRDIATDPATKDAMNDRLKEIKKTTGECNSLAKNVQNVAENIASYAQLEQMKSKTCGQQLGNTQSQACQANPYGPGCQQKLTTDCSDPTVAASNTICVCQRNPADSRCGGASGNFASGMGNRGGAAGGAAGGGADGSLGNFGGMGGDFPNGIGMDPNSKPGAGAGGGSLNKGAAGKASLDMGGGGSGAAGGRGGGGGAGSGINTKIIGGYGFGSGGGSYGGSGSGASSGSGQAGVPYGRGGVGPNGKPVDLRQFMPGGRMDPSRALAGVSGPDGITGPNSDIWAKIRARYFSVSPSLLP